MSRSILEQLEIPQPPYRMARPVASLVSIDELPGKEADEALASERKDAVAGSFEATFGESVEALRAKLDEKVEDAVHKAPPEEAAIVQEKQKFLDEFDIDFPQTVMPADFDESFEQPPRKPVLKEAPNLDSLAKIQELIESARRNGRSPEYLHGLEQQRKQYIEEPKGETPITIPSMPGSPGGPISESLREAGRQAMNAQEKPGVSENEQKKEDEKAINRAEGEGMTGTAPEPSPVVPETDIGSRTVSIEETPEIKAARDAADVELAKRQEVPPVLEAEPTIGSTNEKGEVVTLESLEEQWAKKYNLSREEYNERLEYCRNNRLSDDRAALVADMKRVVSLSKEEFEKLKAQKNTGTAATESLPVVEAEHAIGSTNEEGEVVTGYDEQDKAIWEKPRGEEPLTSAPMPGSPGGMVTDSLREAGSVAMQRATEDELKRRQKREERAAAKKAKAEAKKAAQEAAKVEKAAPAEPETPVVEQQPTAQEKRFTQLEDKIKQLEAQLSAARQGGGAGEAPPAVSGGGEGEPPSDERPTRISEIGEQEGISYWENWVTGRRAGLRDHMASIATVLAKKWQGRIEHRHEKIKKWEESGRESSRKGALGMLKSMVWDENWADYHRARGRSAYRKQEAWNDSRVRRENARDEILNQGAARIDRVLDSQLERIDQYSLQRDEMEKHLTDDHAEHEEYTEMLGREMSSDERSSTRELLDALEKRMKDRAEKKRSLEAKWQAERKRAAKQQKRKEELLTDTVRPTRVDTTPTEYKWLVQRKTRPKGSPKARPGSRPIPGVAA